MKILKSLILFSLFTLVIIGCTQENEKEQIQENVEIELRKCPWCIYADVRGAIAGGFAGSFGGVVGSMIGAVGFGFADSYHEYNPMVGPTPDIDDIASKLEVLASLEIDPLDDDFNNVGYYHNILFQKAITKEYIQGNAFENDAELVDFIFQQIDNIEYFDAVSSSDKELIKQKLLTYLADPSVEYSGQEEAYINEFTSSTFYKMNEEDMTSYINTMKSNYPNNDAISSSISIGYYTYYFWTTMLD